MPVVVAATAHRRERRELEERNLFAQQRRELQRRQVEQVAAARRRALLSPAAAPQGSPSTPANPMRVVVMPKSAAGTSPGSSTRPLAGTSRCYSSGWASCIDACLDTWAQH